MIVLDDDPTGTQSVAGVPVLFGWRPEQLADALAQRPAAVHLLTNSRALEPDEAYRTVYEAATAARLGAGSSPVVLRGDSTLRAHLLEEYLGVRDALHPGLRPPLLLIPALPAAGRITIDGVHLLERDGERVALHHTPYARDPSFAYDDARLVQWAHDRSGGHFPRSAGVEIALGEVRAGGPGAIADALMRLAARDGPCVCVPDAESPADLAIIAAGLDQAWRSGASVIVRCAPAFVGALAGNTAVGHVAPPSSAGGLLVICGSYVPTTTRQLAAVVAAHPGALIEVDVLALAGPRPQPEIARTAAAARERLTATGLAIVSTPRQRPASTTSLRAGERIAQHLAEVLLAIDPYPGAVLAKGGITSHVTAAVGLQADGADVVGPIADGVALWSVPTGRGSRIPYVVFPGNVGGDAHLLSVVERILAAD